MSGVAAAPARQLRLLQLPPYTGFVLRSLLAFALAVYIAYALELDTPYSAGTTVLIVAASARGAVVSKSFWRVLGSLVGCIASILLIAFFAQSPVLFVLGLSIWLGVCTFVSSLLRYFRSYGAVLAGYTITLVAIPAVSDPDRIFDLALARLSVVVIGVLVTGLVFLITDRGAPPDALERQASGLFAESARLARDAINEVGAAHVVDLRRDIAAGLLVLDQTVEFNSVEDAVFARHASDMRIGVASLHAALVGTERMAQLLSDPVLRTDPRIAEARQAMLDVSTALMQPATNAASFDRHRNAVAATRAAIAAEMEGCTDVAVLSALLQTVALLDQVLEMDAHISVLHGVPASGRRIALRAYMNPITAWRNGARGTIACSIAGIFWIVSMWPSGGAMLTLLGPICALVALTDSAAAASIAFLKGLFVSSVAAFVVTYGLLPQTTGFPLLMATLLPFLAVGLARMTKPATAGSATAFLIFFNTQVSASNPMHYDLAADLNTYVAFNAATLCTVLAFRVLLPPDPIAEAMVLMRSIRNAVARVGRGQRQDWLVWEHLQHQKLSRLSRRLAAHPAERMRNVTGAIGAVLIGRHLLHLHEALDGRRLPPGAHAAVVRAQPALRQLHAAPLAAAAAVQRAADELGAPDGPPATLHTAATLHELAALLRATASFFESCSGVPEAA